MSINIKAATAAVTLLGALLVTLLCSACSTANVGTARGVSQTQNFVGRLLVRGVAAAEPQTALVAFIAAPKDDGNLDIRAYLCDGIEDGDLLWVRGPATPVEKSSAALGGATFSFDLTSGSGFHVVGVVTPLGISGTIARKASSALDATPQEFFASRAAEGSGIFDLTAADSGDISGQSLTGDSLSLAKSDQMTLAVGDGAPYVGTLVTVDGTTFDVTQIDLSTLESSELESEGFVGDLATPVKGIVPGTFRAIVLLDGGGFTTMGRLLLPGTGINNVPPQFGRARVALSSRFNSRRL